MQKYFNLLKEVLRGICINVKDSLIYQKYKRFLPPNPKHNDVYIVEFPKSGITWLSFLIANYFIDHQKENVTFYNIDKYVVDIHQLRRSFIDSTFYYQMGRYRFIKSHSTYNPYYYLCIYLMRNPFDVMLSYYYFMEALGLRIKFDEFVKNKSYGIPAWTRHIKAWLIENKDTAQRIHLIRYEDLLDNPKICLIKLFENLGIVYDERLIDSSIEKSSKDKMRKSELIYSRNNPVYKSLNLKFVRKGEKNQKDVLLNREVNKYIINNTKEILDKFYPDLI